MTIINFVVFFALILCSQNETQTNNQSVNHSAPTNNQSINHSSVIQIKPNKTNKLSLKTISANVSSEIVNETKVTDATPKNNSKAKTILLNVTEDSKPKKNFSNLTESKSDFEDILLKSLSEITKNKLCKKSKTIEWGECNACLGGIDTLGLRFNSSYIPNLSVGTDTGETLEAIRTSNNTILIKIENENISKLHLFVDDCLGFGFIEDLTLGTDCLHSLRPGIKIGRWEIVYGTSRLGGTDHPNCVSKNSFKKRFSGWLKKLSGNK